MNSSTKLHRKVLLLLSGGIDSAVCAAMLAAQGREILCLTLRYPDGANEEEVENAKILTKELSLEHLILDFGFVGEVTKGAQGKMLFNVGGSISNCISLGTVSVPMAVELMHMTTLMVAQSHGIKELFWAVHADDLPNPQSEKKLLSYLDSLTSISCSGEVRDCTFMLPFLKKTKAEVVQLGVSLGVDLARTRSCSQPGKGACGVCPQCALRTHAFLGAAQVS